MQIDMIEAEELQQYKVPLQYGFYSEVYYQLFNFFSTHDQTKMYRVNADANSVKDHSYFAFDSADIYKFYGIFYQNETNSLMQLDTKNYMLILDSEHVRDKDTLIKYVEEKKQEFGCEEFASCGVNIDTDCMDEYECNNIAFMLNEVLPGCLILNAPLIYKSVYVDDTLNEDSENIVFINDLATQKSVLEDDETEHIRFLLEIIEKIKADKNPKHVFAYKAGCGLTSDEVAAILAIAESCLNKKVHTSGIVTSKFTNYLTSLFRRENMYLHDYISFLRNFPDCTISLNSMPYLLIKNKAKEFDAKQTIHCLELPFDIEKKEIKSKNAEVKVYSFDQIQEVNISKLFDLDNSDFEIAGRNSKAVQKIFIEMMEYFGEFTEELKNVLLNISNVMIYKRDTDYFISYVSEITAKCPFLIFPLAAGYKYFETMIDLQSNIFYDVRFFSDYLTYIYPYIKSGLIEKNHLFMIPPAYYKGLLLQAMTPSNELLKDKCGLSYEEIGIWSIKSAQTRYHSMALELWTREFVDDKFATIYGGPHPSDVNYINIGMDAWR